MLNYVLRRFGYMIFTLWVIVTLTFILMHSIPGNPFLNPKLSETVRARLMAKYGLDQPLHKQYLRYMGNLLRGDLGISMQARTRTVNEVISQHFPVSASVGIWAILYSVLSGVALGIVAALRRNKWPDYLSMVIAVIGVAVPGFVVGTLLQFLFGVMWKKWFGATLLPVGGLTSWKHYILPAFVLGLNTMANYGRMMRSSMLDVLGQDYIKTAKAKGLSGNEIVWRHAVRNAMLPIITLLGMTIVALLGGALIVETIFAIPGLGFYYVSSITNSDYSMVLGTTIFFSSFLVLSLFLVDIAYGLVDPRIRLTRGKA